MSYQVPTFNLVVNVWRFPVVPPAGHSFQLTGNLAYSRRVHPIPGDASASGMALLLPAGSDIRSPVVVIGPDVVEAPAGTGRYYSVLSVDDIGKGFSNEHRCAVLIPITTYGRWPGPVP